MRAMMVAVSTGAAPYGRYVLRERIARGGMGEVFRAVAVGSDGFEKPVVIKRILGALAADPRFVAMFAKEARLMSRLVHPNIVQVIDYGRGEEGDGYLVLELVNGLDLGRFRAAQSGGRMAPEQAAYVASRVLRGLSHAHDGEGGGGLVHRDVSPGNVLLSLAGEVKVGDFGIALVGSEDAGGPVAGKPAYMAPEQFSAELVDARADLFSTGVLLFEMLCGELPHAGSSVAERRRAAQSGELRPFPESVPPALRELVRRALEPAPEQRYGSARAMGEALRQVRRALPPYDADELADAVRAAADGARSEARPVVNLAQPLGELTRGPGDGGFTVTLAEAPGSLVSDPGGGTVRLDTEPPSERVPAERARPARDRGGLRALWALPLLALLGFGAWWAARDGEGDAGAPASGQSVVPVATPVPIELEPGPPEPAPTALEASARPSAVVSAPRGAPAPVAAPQPLAEPAAACEGRVDIYSKGSWTITGGPVPAQSPGRYTWPCGAYGLSAVSRADPSRRQSHSIVVRSGQTAVVDLR